MGKPLKGILSLDNWQNATNAFCRGILTELYYEIF